MTLQEIARKMVKAPKGILAADESTGTMTKRLASIGVESTLQNRSAFRELVFHTPDLNYYISGIILYDETFRSKTPLGADLLPTNMARSIPQFLHDKGILPGIKVDKGTKLLPGCKNETYTEGLDGLEGRLKEYRDMGAVFTKWRAVITPNYPSALSLEWNANLLAMYAAISQAVGLVPIVEPEVLMEGEHNMETSRSITEDILGEVFYRLIKHNVQLDGMVLKPNMVVPGYNSNEQESEDVIARYTVCCLSSTVPPKVPGIAFLSGGQADEVAVRNLNAINRFFGSDDLPSIAPWRLTFSFGRGLQQAGLKVWQGKAENREKAQEAILQQARMCSLASMGRL